SSSTSDNRESTSSILSKLEIKFVKPADSPTVAKINKDETARKPTVKYAEMYKKTSKSAKELSLLSYRVAPAAELPLLIEDQLNVEARLVEFKNQEIKLCEKIRGLKVNVEFKNIRIERLTNELEELKKEKSDLDSKLTGFQSASKDLDNLLGSQDLTRTRRALDTVLFPPPAQVYSHSKKDISWTGLHEFADDTITDYSRPSLAIESNSDDLQNKKPSITETGASSSTILSKPAINFVKSADIPIDKVETAKKPAVKYAEL
nr:hypothetical protein [Tanacetum cinerariifolium]